MSGRQTAALNQSKSIAPTLGTLKLRLVKETVRFFSDESDAVGTTYPANTSQPVDCCNTYSGECCGGPGNTNCNTAVE